MLFCWSLRGYGLITAYRPTQLGDKLRVVVVVCYVSLNFSNVAAELFWR